MLPRGLVAKHCLGLLAIFVAALSYWPKHSQQQSFTRSVQVVSDARATVGHLPIEQIRVGQRVVTYNSAQNAHTTEVDPKTWKKLSLHAVDIWEDGTRDEHFIETLQPLNWILANQIEVGGPSPIPFDLQEMGGNEGLQATVTKIDDCPSITAGCGRVVISTITHLNNHCCEVVLTDGTRSETITTTERHPFWSSSRQDWVKAIELREAERVHGLGDRALQVERVTRITGNAPCIQHDRRSRSCVSCRRIECTSAQRLL